MMQHFNKYTIQCFLILYCILPIGTNKVQAQKNLVQNGDLESYINCPYMATGIVNVMPTYWYYACRTYFNQNGYANACANGINSNASVPLSAQGYQIPHSGNGYVIVDYLFSNRTYLQTKLRDSLQKNKKYYCEFYIVKWEDLQVSCNNHGMLFTKNAIYPDTVVNTCGPLNIVPQILPYGNPIISDTMNWIKINGIYKAQGGEQYITIGNHATTSNTSYIRNYPSANTYMAKYLIDDVSVIPLDSMCLKADAGRDTTIKVGDSVFIGSYTNGIDTIKWYNAAGQVIDSTRPGFWVKPSATGTTMYIVEQTVNGCYSRDTVYINAVLPLNFINYNVISTKEKSVENIWTTANEINVSHFNIQRSLNAKDFTTIGKVKAENKVLNNYTFTDDKLPITNEPLTLYYRLQSVDNDGRKQYSTVKSLQLKVNSAVSVYPNPAKDLVNISCIGIKEVNVINSLGQTIIHRNLNNNHYQLDISSLPKGIYVLNVISKLNGVYNEKLIVQ